jgi:plastocyanin
MELRSMVGTNTFGTRTSNRGTARLFAVAALALALGACEGDGGTGTGSSDPDPVADATVTLNAQSFSPQVVVLFRDGTVTWNNTSGVTHNINFAAAAVADVPNHADGTNQRDFATVGTFTYQCTIHAGMSGRVTVVEPAP